MRGGLLMPNIDELHLAVFHRRKNRDVGVAA
jgi:hypothetical protein